MADNHAGLAPASPPDQSTRPHLTKESLASREGRISTTLPNAPTRLDMPSSTSPFSSFGDGSGSSSSKPLFYLRDVTSPSLFSQTQSPDTELDILPKLVQSPRPAYIRHLSTPTSFLSEEPSGLLQIPAGSPPGASDSEDYGGPTRASIRAWAKATPAGPPKKSSTRTALNLPQSGSDDSLVHSSLTRTVRDLPVSAESSIQRTSSRSGDNSPGNSVDREASSGDAADGESSESEQNSSSPLSGSPPPDKLKLAAQRELTAPHPHPRPSSPSSHAPPIAHPQPQPAFTRPSADVHQYPTAHPHAHAHAHAHVHSHAHSYPHAHYPSSYSGSSPESTSPAQVAAPALAPIPAPTPTQADELEHPEQRQHRRRHRERERDRERDRERRTRHPKPPGIMVVSMPALPPLRPLRPPPPPLPMRALPTFSPRTISVPIPSEAGNNIFKEIENMLKTTRKPLLRVHREMDPNEDDMGWAPFPTGRSRSNGSTPVRRENDVLEDIRTMVHWSLR